MQKTVKNVWIVIVKASSKIGKSCWKKKRAQVTGDLIANKKADQGSSLSISKKDIVSSIESQQDNRKNPI